MASLPPPLDAVTRRAVVVLEADEASPLLGQRWQNLPLLQLRAEGRPWAWSCSGEFARQPFWEWEVNGHGIGGFGWFVRTATGGLESDNGSPTVCR